MMVLFKIFILGLVNKCNWMTDLQNRKVLSPSRINTVSRFTLRSRNEECLKEK